MNRFIITCATLLLGSTAVLAEATEGDAAKGANVFKKCMACHAVGENAKNKVGPELNGIIDRKMGSVEGFKYSPALLEHNAKGDVWSAEVLSAYLENPRSYMPGIRMVFAGLPKEKDRADLLAYLATFNADGSTK